jgi:hypothetical protein
MKLNSSISISPPPIINNIGQVIYPNILVLDSLDLVFTDNAKNKTISVSIVGIPTPITLWSGSEYDAVGDWTQSQAEAKLTEMLGDDPAKMLRSSFPKTLEENPNHPGTVLVKVMKNQGVIISDNCSCTRHILEMNQKGNDWCVENIEKIVAWLKVEASNLKIVFIDSVAKLLVMRAIKKSRRLLDNQSVPLNDEELDNIT